MITELLTGLAAKAALGVTATAFAVTGAGAAGVLPDPANDAIQGTITAVSGYEFGQSVADRAVDQQGVDGPAIADEAKELGDDAEGAEAEATEAEAAEARDGWETRAAEAQHGLATARDAVEESGTPAADNANIPDGIPAGPEHGQERASERRADPEEAREQGQANRPETTPGDDQRDAGQQRTPEQPAEQRGDAGQERAPEQRGDAGQERAPEEPADQRGDAGSDGQQRGADQREANQPAGPGAPDRD